MPDLHGHRIRRDRAACLALEHDAVAVAICGPSHGAVGHFVRSRTRSVLTVCHAGWPKMSTTRCWTRTRRSCVGRVRLMRSANRSPSVTSRGAVSFAVGALALGTTASRSPDVGGVSADDPAAPSVVMDRVRSAVATTSRVRTDPPTGSQRPMRRDRRRLSRDGSWSQRNPRSRQAQHGTARAQRGQCRTTGGTPSSSSRWASSRFRGRRSAGITVSRIMLHATQ